MTERRPSVDIRGSKWMRLRGLMRKESLQIVRDPSSIAIAFVLPIVLLFLFGYGVSLDAKHVPLGLVIEVSSGASASWTAAFEQSEYFAPRRFDSVRDAEQAMLRGDITGFLRFRADFEANLFSAKTAPIEAVLNGVDANNARIAMGYIQGVWATWLPQQAAARGQSLLQPVSLQSRVWYNPALRSRNFLIPGLIAVIMTLIGALLTAMVVAREWERGTMEALLVTPVTIGEILVGKLLPYFILGMGGLSLSVGMAVWLFGVPLEGSLWVLFAASALFLLTALGMGLTISTVARNQFVAGQLAIIATFLPAFILSGFIFDIHSMPDAVQILTHLIAARYYVAMLQTIFLAGNIWPVLLGNAFALGLMCTIFIGIARKRTVKRLE